jgi:protein-S-isoprenylcysteine O-methyltransferase Ste14
MNRILAVLYGGACYTAFLATFLYAIAFVAGVGAPKHIDNGPAAPWLGALAIDIALLTLFAVQHSGMARPAFKRWWTRFVPASIERSTFVLASSAVLGLVFWLWHPLPPLVWHVESTVARAGLWGVSLFGWLLVLTSSFTIDHFALFGLRQTWRNGQGDGEKEEPFVIRAMYRIVRHPLMLGFLIAFWATPQMTVGHLLFAVVVTGYIIVAVKFLEERDLISAHGDTYRDYQRQVPMLLPGRRRR